MVPPSLRLPPPSPNTRPACQAYLVVRHWRREKALRLMGQLVSQVGSLPRLRWTTATWRASTPQRPTIRSWSVAPSAAAGGAGGGGASSGVETAGGGGAGGGGGGGGWAAAVPASATGRTTASSADVRRPGQRRRSNTGMVTS